VQDLLSGTRFGFEEYPDYIATTCPWGNAIRCYEGHSPNARDMMLGLRYVEFSVPRGCAETIVDFYNGIFSAPGRIESTTGGVPLARICVGIGQELVFRETSDPIPPYDGHHIQVYVHNFSQPHRRLLERGLVSEESDQHQFRFSSIVNLANGEECFKIEHEIRSMRHPLYARPLVNRNPDQSNRNYTPGKDALGA